MNHPIHGGNLDWAAKIVGCPVSSIVDFSASINPLGPSDRSLTPLRDPYAALIHYPDPSYFRLRTAIAQCHDLDPDWILPGNGAAELLTWAGRELAGMAVTVLPVPAFRDYERALQAFGAKVYPWVWDWRAKDLDFDRNAENLPRDRPLGLILNNPHNPTGKLWSLAELVPLFSEFALVVLDEAFMDFLPPDRQPTAIALIDRYPNLVIVRSLTKFYSLPGLRLGYAIARPDRLQKWQKWRDPWSVNGLAVEVGIACLEDVEFQQATWAWLPTAREQLWRGLAAIAGLIPLQGSVNFLLVECERSVLALQKQLLQEYRILIRDCLSFPELGDRFFRVAVRADGDNQRLIEALTQILQASP
jgi:L-threonine-O-3-phosphate decarboxylase